VTERSRGPNLCGCPAAASESYNQLVPAFETLDPELRGVLGKRIRELGLRLEGSPVEPYVRQLYRELERRGLHTFRPVCYLTDEWGCPDMQPILGIPFYLADPALGRLERAIDDLEDEREIMRYMRHEAGHVFNYAYRLYVRADWRAVFGPFEQPYRDKYRPIPFSRDFVRHIEGWYAQKHPDEDFAETFAVWLTPGSAWRRRYQGWPAVRKLRYVDKMARAFSDVEPVVRTGEVDITVDDMRLTVEQFYQRAENERATRIELVMDAHLSEIFLTRKPREGRPAAAIVTKYRRELIDKITYWTGVRRPVVRGLVEAICKNCERMKLWGVVGQEPAYLVALTAFGTTLAMNFLQRGKFMGETKGRRAKPEVRSPKPEAT
jgi:Putative zinc-binding metallo-peptidase